MTDFIIQHSLKYFPESKPWKFSEYLKTSPEACDTVQKWT